MKPKLQKVGRESIRYLDSGGNGRDLVFHHGIGKKPQAYHNLLERLSGAGYRVIAPEMYGRNYLHVQPRTIREYVDLTSEFIHSLGLASPHLIGHSLGGLVAFGVAKDNPESKGIAIALSPAVPMDRAGLNGIVKGARHYLKKRIKTPLKSLRFFLFNTVPVDIHLLRKPAAWAGIIRDIKSLEPDYFKTPHPSLIVHVENDELVELSKDVEEKIKKNRTVIRRLSEFPGLDHNWPISYYPLAAHYIVRFLGQ